MYGISTCSQMYRAVVIAANANVRWAVLQTFMAFSVMHTHAQHAGFSHVVLYYITVSVKKLMSILLLLYLQLEFYPLGREVCNFTRSTDSTHQHTH